MAIFLTFSLSSEMLSKHLFQSKMEKAYGVKKTHMQTIKLKMLDVKVELRRRKKMEQHQTREEKQQLKHAQNMRWNQTKNDE